MGLGDRHLPQEEAGELHQMLGPFTGAALGFGFGRSHPEAALGNPEQGERQTLRECFVKALQLPGLAQQE
jgi:hypothetical protein